MLFFNSAAEIVPAGQVEEMGQALTSAGLTHQYVALLGDLHSRQDEDTIVPGTTPTVLEDSIASLHLYLG